MNGIVDVTYQFFVKGLLYVTVAVFLLGILLNLRRWYAAPKEKGGAKIGTSFYKSLCRTREEFEIS